MTRKAIVFALLFLTAGIWLGCSDDDDTNCIIDPNNNPPIITSMTANPDTIFEIGTTTITVIAEDPDGDSLTYGWRIATPDIIKEVGRNRNVYLVKSCCEVEDTTVGLVISIVKDNPCSEARDTVAVCIIPQ